MQLRRAKGRFLELRSFSGPSRQRALNSSHSSIITRSSHLVRNFSTRVTQVELDRNERVSICLGDLRNAQYSIKSIVNDVSVTHSSTVPLNALNKLSFSYSHRCSAGPASPNLLGASNTVANIFGGQFCNVHTATSILLPW